MQLNIQSGAPLVSPMPLRERASSLGHRPTHGNGHKRTLSARRGSISAPDPHGKHSLSTPRCALSRLTVVRVPKEEEKSFNGNPISPRRAGSPGPKSPTFADSNASVQRPHSPSRLSFASASFSSPQSPTRSQQRINVPEPISIPGPKRGMCSAPSSPARMSFASASFSAPGRPKSPTITRHARSNSASSISSINPIGSLSSYHKLSPTQIYDLAKSSSYPTSASPAPSNSFTQLADDVFLPFIDRPSEVAALISGGGNAKIMRLVAQSFSQLEQLGQTTRDAKDLVGVPESWTFEDLMTWLTQTSRSEISDTIWVQTLRKALRLHSEVLWERVKSMLGIPFDLDLDTSDYAPKSVTAKIQTSEIVNAPSGKDQVLSIDQIHPLPFSPAVQLGDISESIEEEGTDSNPSIKGSEPVLGLRVCTSVAFSQEEKSPKSPKSPSHSRHGSRHSTVPIRSSPLAPPKSEQQANGSNFVSRSPDMVGALYVRATQAKHSLQSARPMFPMNFAKIGLHPTLLRVN